ncbi:flagellar hook-length control protein FliK [Loktanella sp. Alg231-35]|uniref:flagellar hook-length control protein FliK n=1 Tax=Loktanella sp. Alg231-35 TaxID=1922220 RepID=UPI00131F15AF|nr:flagellar hook-length control protein FliK [Loktanella sp. Alg231-35]
MIPLLAPKEAVATGLPPDALAEVGDTEDVSGFGVIFAAEDPDVMPVGKSDVLLAAEPDSDETAIPSQKATAADADLVPVVLAPVPRDKPVSQASKLASGPEDEAGLRNQSRSHPANGASLPMVDRAEKALSQSSGEPNQPQRGTVAQSVVEGQIPQGKQVVIDPQGQVAGSTKAPEEPPSMVQQKARPDSPQLPLPREHLATQNKGAKPAAPAVAVGTQGEPKAEQLLAERMRPSTQVPASQIQAAAAHSGMVQPLAVAIAQVAQGPLGQQIERQIKPIDPDIGLGQAAGDRPATISAAVSNSTPGAGPEVARHTAHQIAMAVTNTGNNVTEISLNPEELGRVRLSMTASEGGITLNIAADRPETMDLLRRHIDALAQEFQELGYESLTFSFGSQSQDSTDKKTAEVDQFAAIQVEEVADQPVALHSPLASAGLDLRL